VRRRGIILIVEDGGGIGTSGKSPSGVRNQSDIVIGSVSQKWITICGKR
jgi:hypothetical protein